MSAKAGLYVHIPFCRSKCAYCDFYSITELSQLDAYLLSLIDEASMRSGFAEELDTLYLGGGTPSLMAPEQLLELVTGLARVFSFTTELEISCEVNPGDLTDQRMDALQAAGVSRLSLGLQSLDDDVLTQLGRRHDADGARRAVERVQGVGLELSTDLISGLAFQSASSWSASLDELLSFAPEHVSIYDLTVAPKTPIARRLERGELPSMTDDEMAERYLETARVLSMAGYEHYEVSSWARRDPLTSEVSAPPSASSRDGSDRAAVERAPSQPSPHRSRHNQKYWRRVPTLGLGPAAHSFDGRARWWNLRDVSAYMKRLESGRAPEDGRELLTDEQIRLEELSLSLRTADGIAVDGLDERRLERLISEDLVCLRGARVQPTVRGFLMADALARHLA